ncbi:MAG: ribosome biogenesis GTPase Der [Caldisericales bacterium]|nr:ribosome biogenesis GTPase Der [Caldisericales bacterium]
MENEISSIKPLRAKNLPIVAFIGRPSVGKSTIFNRILRKARTITDQSMGVTRDRIMEDFIWNGVDFTLMDTGGIAPEASTIQSQVSLQSEMAIGIADVIVFMVDAQIGPTKEDIYVARMLRKSSKKVILVANKADNRDWTDFNFNQLGFGDPFTVSATSGRNLAELLDLIVENVGQAVVEDMQGQETEEELPPRRIAIAGRPNVGKSSLLNAFLGEKRTTVSNVPGTTRDAVDTLIEYDGTRYILVDTAGIKKRYKYDEQLDYVTIKRSEQAIHRSDLVILVIDGSFGATSDDQQLARYIADEGKACVVVVNKIDLVEDKKALEDNLSHQLRFIDYAKRVNVSALTGKNITKIFPHIIAALDNYNDRITTGKLNRWLAQVTDKQPPNVHKGKVLKIYYVTQVTTRPPTFQFFVNDVEAASESYMRFLENNLREEFGLEGTPVRFSRRQH